MEKKQKGVKALIKAAGGVRALNEENKKIVIDTLIDLNEKGKTIVVVSHDKDF